MGRRRTPQTDALDLVVGTNLRLRRKKLNLTLSDVADYLGTSKTALSFWERGATEAGYIALMRLAELYSCKIDDFFEQEVNTDAYRASQRRELGRREDRDRRILERKRNSAVANDPEPEYEAEHEDAMVAAASSA